MYAFIARQPIFNIYKKVRGYELLYRDGETCNAAVFSDGDAATCRLMSDAITQFGLPMLTNKLPAFVNFTQNLILSDFARLANPRDIVIELLEEIEPTDAVVQKLLGLRQAGYSLALDDYTGDPKFDDILNLMDIIKVDFRLTDRGKQEEIVRKMGGSNVQMLAEKVETPEDFDRAVDMGYTLFQGYFFEKPKVIKKKIATLAASSYGRILYELNRPCVDFEACAKIVHSDAVMTYMLMQKVRTLAYYRGNIIYGIRLALVMMGTEEIRRWIILLLARENNVTQSDELPRAAYLRGTFAEQLMIRSGCADDSGKAFLLGMFSMLDKILGVNMEELMKDIGLDDRVVDALLGVGENIFSDLLQYIIIYEMANPNLILPDIGLAMDTTEVAELYMQCIVETDMTFNGFGGNYNC